MMTRRYPGYAPRRPRRSPAPTPVGAFAPSYDDGAIDDLIPRSIPVRQATRQRGRPVEVSRERGPSPRRASEPTGDVEDWGAVVSEDVDSGETRQEGASPAQLRAALVDLQQAKERLARDSRRELDKQRRELVGRLLPVLDNLDRTLRAAQKVDSADTGGLLDGVKIVRDQFADVLSEFGLERVSATGQPFDPSVHEAVGVVPVEDERQHGMVVDVVLPGYRLAQKLVRPAKVRVGRMEETACADWSDSVESAQA